MRFVEYNPSTLPLPDGWAEKVEKLKEDLFKEEDEKKRADLIDKNSDVWKAVKYELSKLFNYKCWYTESPQQGTDVDVDHFRPKKRVAELKDEAKQHPGYWWLAFNLENYRYSCIVANRKRRDVETGKTGGKADCFPVLNETKRAWTPDCDCDEEQPILLDPCKPADVALITFKDDGEAMPRYSIEKKPMAHKRADTSINYYNINHSDFRRARIELRDKMIQLIRDASKYYNKLEEGDAIVHRAYGQTINDLMSMRDKKSPYSSFCVAFLDNKKHQEALEDVLAGVFI